MKVSEDLRPAVLLPGRLGRGCMCIGHIFCFVLSVLVSCKTANPVSETPIFSGTALREGTPILRGEGITGEILRLTETGVLPSMQRAIELIRSQGMTNTEFGKVMSAVYVFIVKRIYPDYSTNLPVPDLNQSHPYIRILRNAERGVYTAVPSNSTDYLEHTLPFLALFYAWKQELLLPALPDLEKARTLKPDSALAPYFSGMVYERAGRLEEAAQAYTRCEKISQDFYPASIGLARVMLLTGKNQEALRILEKLSEFHPENITIKRQFAVTLYETGEWRRAEPIIADFLRQNNRDYEFLLMQARILVETGRYLQAQASLDTYSAYETLSRMYMFLRARIQAENYNSPDRALGFLRTLLGFFPDDREAMLYATGLLLESLRAEDQAEGRGLLRRLLQNNDRSVPVLALGVQDAVNRENWREAQSLIQNLLTVRRSARDLFYAYQIERGLGNNSSALSFARELYERDSSKDEGISVYASALIDSGRPEEASRLIDSRLASISGGAEKSGYYYLRSRIDTDEETALQNLRSALYENPRNLNALIAMFEIYHRRKDERRAVYYLKQAIAIAPSNPRLKRYETQYSGLMGN